MTKLRNSTDLPDSLIREVIDFVRPNGVRNIDVYVENRRHAGSALAHTRGYVTVGVGSEERFPVRMNWNVAKGGYCFDDWVRFREEMLVVLMAHEMRHQWQFGRGQSFNEMVRRNAKQGYISYNLYGGSVRKVRRSPSRRRRGQKGGRERDADIYAQRLLREWRRAHPIEPFWGAAEVEA